MGGVASGGSRMSRSEQGSPQGVDRAEQWLGPGPSARSRRWAYADLLLADGARADELSALAGDLAVDLADLRRLQNEVYDQVVRVAALEGRVQALMQSAGVPVGRGPEPREEIHTLPSFPSSSNDEESREQDALLLRCEGFEVDSPVGLVGIVEGLRFGSRIDVPDFLEVRGGRLGRELLLVPVEAVQEISPEEERVLVRGVSPTQTDISHELVERLRKALHVMTASLR
jgi:hypothetical protein